MISKAQAIKNVTKDDISKTNSQIKKEVFLAYGLKVESNQIIGVLGSEKSRKWNGKVWLMQQEWAREYLRRIGDFQLAIRLIHSTKDEKGGGGIYQ